MEPENTAPKQSPSKSKKSTAAEYWRVTSHDFLFLLAEAELILYPGSYAVINEDEYRNLPEQALKMVKLEEISESEYNRDRPKQGILGVG